MSEDKVVDFRSKKPVEQPAGQKKTLLEVANRVVVDRLEELLAAAREGKIVGAVMMTVDSEGDWAKSLLGAALVDADATIGQLEIIKAAIIQHVVLKIEPG